MTEVKSITPQEVYELHKKGEKPYLIDVRTLPEFEDLRASIVTEHIPLDDFDPEAIGEDPSSKLYFICRSGRRSFEAAAQCLAYGFDDIYNVEGGTLEWEAQDLPLTSGAKKKS